MWEPIKTAPRGYVPILAWSSAFETSFRVFFDDELNGFIQSMGDDDILDEEYDLTHWMSLPPAPVST